MTRLDSLTEQQIQIVLDAQQPIIDKPVRACVNSESCFVAKRIRSVDKVLGDEYWSWVCAPSCAKYQALFGDARIVVNQNKIDEIDGKYTMPAWGYKGT